MLSKDERIYVSEYIINFEKLVEIAQSYDLELELSQNFLEFYSENQEKNFDLLNRMVFSKLDASLS